MNTIELYQEKHFLHNRDPEAYKVRQSGSCLYLVELLNGYSRGPGSGMFGLLCSHLRRVHLQQYEDIGIDAELPEGSFYFDSLFPMLDSETDMVQRIWVHCVSYFRGVQRYKALVDVFGEDNTYRIFYRDALLNGHFCMDFLNLYCSKQENQKLMAHVVKCETEVIQKIDEFNSQKVEFAEAIA